MRVVVSDSRLFVRRTKPTFSDERGTITSILDKGTFRRIVLVYTKKGAVRGNHYHRNAGHYVYVLRGKLKLFAKLEGKSKSLTLRAGSLVWIPHLVPHAFVALEDSEALEFGPRSYSREDAQKVEEPLAKLTR